MNVLRRLLHVVNILFAASGSVKSLYKKPPDLTTLDEGLCSVCGRVIITSSGGWFHSEWQPSTR